MTVTHQGVENIEINSGGGDDRMAVKKIHTRTVFNTGAGNDSVYLGSNAALGDLGQPDTNVGGTLNLINAAVIVNGQGLGDQDLLMLDDTGDGVVNHGTLTASQVVNGVHEVRARRRPRSWPRRADRPTGGSVTYRRWKS